MSEYIQTPPNRVGAGLRAKSARPDQVLSLDVLEHRVSFANNT